MRMLIVEGIASALHGGAEKSMLNFCHYLKSQHNELYLGYESQGDFCDANIWNSTNNIKISSFRIQGIFSYIRNIYRTVAFIHKNNIEVIFTHTIHGFPFLRLVKMMSARKIKLVVYLKWVYNGSSIGKLNRWGFRGFDKKIAVNLYISSYWTKQINSGPKKIELVPDGIEFSDLTQRRKIKNKKNILFAGRIYEGKGLHLLLQAIELLSEKKSNFELIVAGNFPTYTNQREREYQESIRVAMERLNKIGLVKYIGYCDNLSELISTSDLVVVSSIWPDAQPLIIFESIAQNIPVIGSKVGGIPGILPKQLLFDLNARSLCDKIEEILYDDLFVQNSDIKHTYMDIKKRYDVNKTNKQLYQILNN